MIIVYTQSINPRQEIRSFHCHLPHFETVLDTLSLIAAAGSTFLEIYIIENGCRTNLAPQVFTGQDLTKPIRALQAEWEAVLSQSIHRSQPDRSRVPLEIALQRIDQFETLMAEYNDSIIKLEKMIIATDQQLSEGLRKDRLLTHYHTILNRHYCSLKKAQAGRDKYLDRLTKLKRAYMDW